MSEFHKRIIFGVLAAPLFIFLGVANVYTLLALTLFLTVGGTLELWFVSKKLNNPFNIILSFLAALYFPLFILFTSVLKIIEITLENYALVIFLPIMLFLSFFVFTEIKKSDLDGFKDRMFFSFLSFFYIGFLGSYVFRLPLSVLDNSSFPEYAPFVITLAAIFGSDTIAYFIGKFLGKSKMAPIISPKKTVAGGFGSLLGGVVGSFIAVLATSSSYLTGIGIVKIVVFGIAIGIFGQLGDLFISLIKRVYKIKDSSKIFPGHGGILDRGDSILLCAPIAYYLFRFLL